MTLYTVRELINILNNEGEFTIMQQLQLQSAITGLPYASSDAYISRDAVEEAFTEESPYEIYLTTSHLVQDILRLKLRSGDPDHAAEVEEVLNWFLPAQNDYILLQLEDDKGLQCATGDSYAALEDTLHAFPVTREPWDIPLAPSSKFLITCALKRFRLTPALEESLNLVESGRYYHPEMADEVEIARQVGQFLAVTAAEGAQWLRNAYETIDDLSDDEVYENYDLFGNDPNIPPFGAGLRLGLRDVAVSEVE